MSSNDNHPEKYNPPYTGNSRGVTSYLNQSMIVIASAAAERYGIERMKSADLYVHTTQDKPEARIYFYTGAQVGKFKVNFLNKTARISVRGFASFFSLDLPADKSAPFDLREIDLHPPIDNSFEVLPDCAVAFMWPKITNPMPRQKKKPRDPYKKR